MISRWRGSSSSNHGQRPLLQGLGQQGVVGVGERPPGEVPGLVPAEVRLVEQDAHQLGDGQRRVRVVELDGHLLGERAPVGIGAAEAAHESASEQATRKYSCTKRSRLPQLGGVVGIEDAGQRFGASVVGQRADELAVAERLEVEVVSGAAAAQSRSVLIVLPP